MKIKPQIFTAVTAGVFVITILVYVLSLVIDFKQQSARSAIKFETISASLNENLMENDVHSSDFYGQLIESCGDGKEIKYLQIVSGNEPVFTYPAELENTNSKFQFTKTFTKKITIPEKETVTIIATLYTIKASTFYNKSIVSFIIILSATIACVIYLVLLSLEEKDTEQFSSDSEVDDFVPGETVPQDDDKIDFSDETPEPIEKSSFDFEPIISKTQDADSITEDADEKQDQVEQPEIKLDNAVQEQEEITYSEINSPKEKNAIHVLQDKLNFSSSNLEDISLVKICIRNLENYSMFEDQIEDLIFEVYKNRDLIFKTNTDEFSIIEPNTNIDSSIETANEIYLKLNDYIAEQQIDVQVNIGITSRSERIISAEKFSKEAEQALLHSMQNKDSPIIAYRIDVQKYRNYLSSGEL